MELPADLADAGFTAEFQPLRYVRGWPENSPKPYRVYRDGKYLAAFGTRGAMLIYARSKRDGVR